MRRPTSILLGLAIVVGFAATTASASPPANLRAMLESHAFESLEGEAVELAPLGSEVVVLNFWAEWCRPCRRELPTLDRWHRTWPEGTVRFICVSVGKQAHKARRMADELQLELPLYHDGPDGLARDIDIPALPITYVIDGSGKVVMVSTGSDAKELGRLRESIEALIPSLQTADPNGADEESAR